MKTNNTVTDILCYHCGEQCPSDNISIQEKHFCCDGCKLVFEILNENNLCQYYDLSSSPGQSQRIAISKRYDFLDDPVVQKRLLDFENDEFARITFFIPSIHCSACIWLLENLNQLRSAIIYSSVNFLERKATVVFHRNNISLRSLVELLVRIGYEPKITFETRDRRSANAVQRSLYYKVGIAGFAFGNIMLLSFPEYLAIDAASLSLKVLFGYLILLISVPVFFYCSSEYFISAYKGLRSGIMNIDLPLAIGIAAFYSRSLYEILSHTGPGYMDSFTGLIFFLLIGRIFQNKTYAQINFERDYESYFPIAVNVKKGENEDCIPLAQINIGDRLVIRNNEIIPVDSVLIDDEAHIDYSFITGESALSEKRKGDIIYAGGRQSGPKIEITAAKNVSQSYLTQLWNDSTIKSDVKNNLIGFANFVSKYFTFTILLIAVAAGVVWSFIDASKSIQVVCAVLIISCPCGVALSTPFALGNALRIFGRNNFFLKNIHIIEKLTKATSIVFDKTGTITQQAQGHLTFTGVTLTGEYCSALRSLTINSTHPFSRQISEMFKREPAESVDLYVETEAAGIEGFIGNKYYRLGSKKFVLQTIESQYAIDIENIPEGSVHFSADNQYLGAFLAANMYRDGFEQMVKTIMLDHKLSVLSGDSSREQSKLQEMLGDELLLYFNQSPFDKIAYIQSLQEKGEVVLMVGDGLNDSGALKQSDIGIVVSDDVLNFSPASDGILRGDRLKNFAQFIQFSFDAVRAIKYSFAVSAIYNIIGIYFAATAQLTALISAILMPISSITIVVFTLAVTAIYANKRGLTG